MLSNIGRAAIKRISGSHVSTNRFLATFWQLQRVEGQQNVESVLKAPSASFPARRSYATATKATQTKTTTAKKPATKEVPAKKSTTKEPAAKKTVVKKPIKKAAKKPAAKKLAKKSAKKPVKKTLKAKPKKAKKAKTPLTDSQKLRKKLRELKVAALISENPKEKPQSAYRVLNLELATGSNDITAASKEASAKYKSVSTAELERLNHIANENKAANAIAYKNWVESHTPEEIRLANLARQHIRRLTSKTSSPRLIKDDRMVKRPMRPMIMFVKERFQSGDFAGIRVTEAMKRIAQEFKELSPAQLKPLQEASAADDARYIQEYKTVYKHDPVKARLAKAQAQA
ncbi:a5e783da-a106-442e-aa52-713864d804d1 [Sclerotinia trifoliorum]|uniref:A5e783da-a106-442e-aa52-713864d804d1 n=1 Tax=Sclerotinia trifoliorum TaxID=28548 RepID=A0A8H2ZU55_9HELO|nr:a5e783da-a106-442e-aa52-713864d804d1 [Sclerotinia trifoliorum]